MWLPVDELSDETLNDRRFRSEYLDSDRALLVAEIADAEAPSVYTLPGSLYGVLQRAEKTPKLSAAAITDAERYCDAEQHAGAGERKPRRRVLR